MCDIISQDSKSSKIVFVSAEQTEGTIIAFLGSRNNVNFDYDLKDSTTDKSDDEFKLMPHVNFVKYRIQLDDGAANDCSRSEFVRLKAQRQFFGNRGNVF